MGSSYMAQWIKDSAFSPSGSGHYRAGSLIYGLETSACLECDPPQKNMEFTPRTLRKGMLKILVQKQYKSVIHNH